MLFFCISLSDDFIAEWMDASSGSALLLMISTNTAARHTFLPVFFYLLCRLPRHYCGFLCIVRSAAFSHCNSSCVFLLHSRIICCLPTMGVAVSGSPLQSPTVLPYIFIPVFLCILLEVLLNFHFHCSFRLPCCPVYLVCLCMRYYFFVYTGILAPICSF